MTAHQPLPRSAFALVALAPVAVLLAGIVWSGIFLWAALLYMTMLTLLLDQLLPLVEGDETAEEFPAADAVLVVIAFAHAVVLPLATWGVAGDSGLSGIERGLVFLSAGFWFGQVAHPAAHELIHRPSRVLFRMGVAIYTSLLFGHHASAHRLVHHRHVASPLDPNSAREGESFYRFARRAWRGSFVAGYLAERDLRLRSGPRRLHPYALYLTGGMASLGVAWAVAGFAGVAVWALLAFHAQGQILLSDYVQHYGLVRAAPDGRTEPVGPRHSWNTAHWFSSAMMLNAPRHSDHHVNPARPYPGLRLPAETEAPRLPWPLPMACAMALFPRLWGRVLRPHLARWKT